MNSPLLGSSDREIGRAAKLAEQLRRFWELSRAKSYLESPTSRRFLQPALALAAFYTVVRDYIEGAHGLSRFEQSGKPSFHVFALGTSLLGLCFPKTSLWRDVLISAVFIKIPFDQHLHDNYWIPVLCLGVHAAPILAWLMVSMIWLALQELSGHPVLEFMQSSAELHRHQTLSSGLPYAIGYAACVSIYALLDYQVVVNFHENERYRKTNLRLLTQTTDGYCTVDQESSCIFSGAALEKSLGSELTGRRLSDFVVSGSRAEFASLLMKSQPDTALVTFRKGSFEFDARVTAYAEAKSSVDICIQIQGEIRQVVHESMSKEAVRRTSSPISKETVRRPSSVSSQHSFKSFNAMLTRKRRQTKWPRQFDTGTVVSSQSAMTNLRHTILAPRRSNASEDDCPEPYTGVLAQSAPEGSSRWFDVGIQTGPVECSSFEGMFLDQRSVHSQSSRLSVDSFWDAVRLLTGSDLRPNRICREYLATEMRYGPDTESQLLEGMEQNVDPEVLRAQLEEMEAPPISAKEWVNAAFSIAENCLVDWAADRFQQSLYRDQCNEEAAASLAAAVVQTQPINDLPCDLSSVIAAGVGNPGVVPPPLPEPTEVANMRQNFFGWYRTVLADLYGADPTDEEVWTHWEQVCLRQLALRDRERDD